MRAVFVLSLLVACSERGAPAEKEPDPSETSTVPTTTSERVAFANPADAIDLDPEEGVLHVELVATPTAHQLLFEDGPLVVQGYSYNGQTPGPTLRAEVGDLLIVDLVNAMDVATTIHWHGVAAPYEMDGATWQTDPIDAGGSFTYTFVLEDAGTFWYHPHFDTERQVDLGLYGMLIVEDPAEPVADDELVVVLDTWEEAPTDDEVGTGVEDHHGLDHTPTRWTVNNLELPVYEAAAGTRVRVRMVNVSNTGYLDLPPQRWIAADQGLLPAAVENERILLGPGDRAEVEWSVGESWTLTSEPYHLSGGAAWGDPFELMSVAADDGAGGASSPIAWPFPGGTVAADPPYTDITYVFAGNAGGDGWMINGEMFPEVTVERLVQGTVGIIEVRNLSPSEHPFHLHGHEFEVLSIDGEAPSYKRVEDTVNVAEHQTLRLQVLADNPGFWMTHCHILPHAHEGMMTVIEVAP